MSFVYVDVRKRANVLDGAASFTLSSVKDLGCSSSLRQCFCFVFSLCFFLVCFFFSDIFNFKILINYSKASVSVLPHKQTQEYCQTCCYQF